MDRSILGWACGPVSQHESIRHELLGLCIQAHAIPHLLVGTHVGKVHDIQTALPSCELIQSDSRRHLMHHNNGTTSHQVLSVAI